MILVVHFPHISDVLADIFLMILSLVRVSKLSGFRGAIPHPVVILGPLAPWVEVVFEEADLRILIADLLTLQFRQ
jgi:hypothetical protein